MKQMKHWQDPVTALLGVWLVLSPWALGYQSDLTAMANAVIVGLLLVAAALGAIFLPRAWEEWTEGVLGLWLAISPWALGFSTLSGPGERTRDRRRRDDPGAVGADDRQGVLRLAGRYDAMTACPRFGPSGVRSARLPAAR